MNKKILLGGGLIIVSAIVIWYLTSSGSSDKSELIVKAQKGEFIIDITTTGELEAKSSVKILGPSGLRAAQIWNVKIDDIVDEGTLVDSGDYIARLDRTELMDKIQNRNNDLQQSISKYTQTKLDTALELRKARDELINLQYAVEEREIVLSQSQYEPPAKIKQAEIDLAKAKRELQQAKENYKLKSRKAVAQMQEAAARLAEDQDKYDFLNNLMNQFTITAKESGMVIYKRTWGGAKQGVGATIEPWDPVVATLPDLSSMVSKTYVNEVDIRIINKGQEVNIGLDAFPDKKLTGNVIAVANVGEQKPNSDSKVFQVSILINESDTTLRPAMTTSNNIVAEIIPDAVFIPLECLYSQGDSITYVVKKSGIGFNRQQVVVGKTNANEAVIESGVQEGDRLYLSLPDGAESANIQLLDEASTSVAKN